MRQETSYHSLSLHHGVHAQNVLNVNALLTCLKRPKGKKRAAPTAPDRPRKKARRPRTEDKAPSSEDDEPKQFLVCEHTFELQYKWSEDEVARKVDEGGALAHSQKGVAEVMSKIGSQATDLGMLVLRSGSFASAGRIVALQAYTETGSYVLTLPDITFDFDAAAHDLRLSYLSDPLVACHRLSSAGRAVISARASLHPEPTADKSQLPFRIRVEISVSLNYPSIVKQVPSSVHNRVNEVDEAQRRVLWHVFPPCNSPPAGFAGNIDVSLLFSILGRAPPIAHDHHVQPQDLRPTLLPFQRRSVAWMLSREGQTLSESGSVEPSAASRSSSLFWEETQVEDEKWYVNRLRGVVSRTKPDEDEDALGGILAEEPGLGKTLECIALIMLNPAIGRGPVNKRWDEEAKVYVKEIKTTLIVTPASLAPQWVDEFKLHAPTLKVLVYDGWQKVHGQGKETSGKQKATREGRGGQSGAKARREAKKKAKVAATSHAGSDIETGETGPSAKLDEEVDGIVDWCTYVNTFDVCITTYNVLQQDLSVARPPPVRPRRETALYTTSAHARSPLITCEWYRVIMDEVQMVGGGRTQAMVSLIPRLLSFAVSGTPARAQVADLIHVLDFLRVSTISNNPRLWSRLLLPSYVNDFVSLFRRYAIRTVKTEVQDELTIPAQTRYLVPIEQGPVERHVYTQNFYNACLDLGLDVRGIAVREDWEADTTVLRAWLRKLRGICTHPQVGQLSNRADRQHKSKGIKSMSEVLEDMRQQNWRDLMEDRRYKVQQLARIAQLEQVVKDNANRYQIALQTLLAAEKDARLLVNDVQTALAEHLKQEASLEASRNARTSQNDHSENSGKGKGRARNDDASGNLSSLSDDESVPFNKAGEEHMARRAALQNRLRDCRVILHQVLFFKANVYNILGESHADAEIEAYAAAEELRRLVLKGTEETAARAMEQLKSNPSIRELKNSELDIAVPYLDKGGPRSADLMEEANEFIESLLNEQSALIWEWRQKLIKLLTQSLTSKDEDEDADGQEYARSIDTQGEAEAYLEAYAALLSDRREALTAERTLLAAHDTKEAHIRRTKAAKKASRLIGVEMEAGEDGFKLQQHLAEQDVRPEIELLRKSLRDERKALTEDFAPGRALKSIVVDLQAVIARIHKVIDPEKELVRGAVRQLRDLIVEQSKLMDRLHSDLVQLRKAFNERISYFRQLQEISDSVTEVEFDGVLSDVIETAKAEQTDLDIRINTGWARQRYLDHLTTSQEDGSNDDENCCILCRCEFSRGHITPCAHIFCETCLKGWLARKEGKVCPVCRKGIDTDQLQRFSLKKKEDDEQLLPRKLVNNELPKSHRRIEYNFIDKRLLEDIQTMESLGNYGSKIQTVVRHLLYLELSDPGSKTIVFSAWADSLLIIQHALRVNGISCLRIDQHSGKENAAKRFRTDSSISVLLLHGERENAGLNVTCASRVFLVESVVNHAFELQAIARIDRMGQLRPTEVYCYYTEDTVEKSILDLAAKQGQSLYTRDNSAGTLNVAPFALASSKNAIDSPAKKKQKGDFVFKTDDMLAIFFPHLFEDVEYLLPPDNVDSNEHPTGDAMRDDSQPIAGPSRLHS